VLHCAAVCCSVCSDLQCGAVWCGVVRCVDKETRPLCVLQRVVAFCNMLVCAGDRECETLIVLQYVTVRCSVLQCVAARWR